MKKILYISGSMGLGHVTRDMAIAAELRRLDPEVEISWLGSELVCRVLKEAGEKIVPQSAEWADENLVAAKAAHGYRLNVVKWTFMVIKSFVHNMIVFKSIARSEPYELFIGDECYDVFIGMAIWRRLAPAPFVAILDFYNFMALTKNPLDIAGSYFWKCVWEATLRRIIPTPVKSTFFVGEEDDIPDDKIGFLLPQRRDAARALGITYMGYVLPFDPSEYADRDEVRRSLGYGDEPLIICTVGGTAVGKELLELCGQAFTHVRKTLPDLHMILVCGPLISPESLSVPEEVEVRGYVPDLYKHLAASDLAIAQGGGTTTLELTALRRPFLYFPLDGHFEQQKVIADRLARHGAGTRLTYSEATPVSLAEQIVTSIGKDVSYASVPLDGALKIAEGVNQLLK